MRKYRLIRAEAGKVNVHFDGRPVVSRLPLGNRISSAAPDIVMTAMFLWCWLAPTAWRPTLASELGLLLIMEFFALHSSMFLGGMVPMQRESAGVRLVTAMIVMAFYIPVAGGFAYFHGGWTPVLGFAWLLLSRVVCMLAGQGSAEFESKRMRFYWGAAVSYYVLGVMLVLFLPLPKLGFRGVTDLFWDKWWAISPVKVIAWGFFYFASQAATKLLEKPEWIENIEEPA